MRSVRTSCRTWHRLVAPVAAACLLAGCATGAAFRHGQEAARSGDWDRAVEHYRIAVQEEPRNAAYRAALQRAMLNASREHLAEARALEAGGALAEAVREYRIAGELDPGNSYAAGRALELERDIRDRLEASRPRSPIEEMQDVARRETAPPLLDPASGEPLSLRFVDQSLQDILDFIGNIFQEDRYKELGGPILIAKMADDTAERGLEHFIYFLSLLSVNLAILNLMPIPALDGGHLVFLTLETVMRRPLSQRKREFCQQVGLVLILGLMILVTFNDLNRLVIPYISELFQ